MFHAHSPDEVKSRPENNGVGASSKVVVAVRAAVGEALAARPQSAPLLLAVSGGPDSMTLLDAVHAVAPTWIAGVACFDHRSGGHSAAGVELVRRATLARGLPLSAGAATAEMHGASEAEWRAARWRFLREVAKQSTAGAVATGHSWDDQAETVCMRILRGAGARGLAALAAPGPVIRPLLAVSRATIERYVAARALEVLRDPSNHDRRALRTRVRLDLLPALERCQPGFRAELVALGARAARWRSAVEAWVQTIALHEAGPSELLVAEAELAEVGAGGLAVLWPALLARMGVVADRRGTDRLTRFTSTSVSGQEIQLAGGVRVRRRHGAFVVSVNRPMDDPTP